MMTSTRSLATTALLALLAIACGGGNKADTATSDADGGSSASTERESDNPTERPVHAHIVISGGKLAGTYDTTGDGACTGGTAGLADMGVALAVSSDSIPTGPAIQNATYAAKLDAAHAGTKDFAFTALVQGQNDAISIVINPAKGEGSGTSSLTGDFPRYKVKMQGTTKDGAKVDATLDCAD
jgi:hypothetical protein